LTACVQVACRRKANDPPPPGETERSAQHPTSSSAPGVAVAKIDRLREMEAMRYWAQWRGPLGTGVAPHADPPVEWSEHKNIRWKTPLSGRGHSSPVIWADRVFLTTAVPSGDAVRPGAGYRPGEHGNLSAVRRHEFIVLAVSRRDGKVLWRTVVREGIPHEGGHYTGTFGSASPIADGEHVFAFFGSNGLYCLDMDGHVKWKTDLGDMHSKHGHGEGSSPALYGETIVVNWDHEGQSFLIALDKRTGKERWKVNRDEVTSWSTPIFVEHKGTVQVVVSATNRVRGYDLATGDVIWECGGLSRNVVASPVSADGMVYAGSSYGKQAMLAIRLENAKGDITDTDRVAWAIDRYTPYVPSPLLYKGRLYFLRHYQGLLSCLEARSGEVLYGPARLEGIRNVYASPVAAAGRIYITSRGGVTLVLNHGDEGEVLAQNLLDDSFSASAALVGDEIYLRGEQHLYCIGAAKTDNPQPTTRSAAE